MRTVTARQLQYNAAEKVHINYKGNFFIEWCLTLE